MMLCGTVLVLLLLICDVTVDCKRKRRKNHSLHRQMSQADLQWYFGVSSLSQVPEYEIVSPYQSDEEGNFLSHDFISPINLYGHKAIQDAPSRWCYTINALGHQLRLDVRQSKAMLLPWSAIETHHTNGSTTISRLPTMSHCIGHVTSHPGSSVAISNHDGLDGLIRLKDYTLYIRPLHRRWKRKRRLQDARPHLVYRVRVRDDSSFMTSLNSNAKYGKKYRRFARDVTTKMIQAIPENMKSSKRSNDRHKYLEMALVADNYAISSIGERIIPYHLMMLAHLTNTMFHDESIGTKKISLVIIKVVLKKDGFGYGQSASKEDKLSKLSSWARSYFPHEDSESRHPDVVSLITKGNRGGYAQYRSTCHATFGTTVSGDFGLGTAQTLTHETAHTLGIGHDGGRRDCPNTQNIMSSAIPGGRGALKWSPCSKEQIQKFLSGADSSCLNDSPRTIVHQPYLFHGKLPGQIYDRDTQCRLNYGPAYRHCKQRLSDCGSLFCTTNDVGCSSNISPPVDGTKCGERLWCIKGECVDDGSPMIDGGWSEWSGYSRCSHQCGGGVQWKARTCTKPSPKGGGLKCEGPDKSSWRVCNTRACAKDAKSSRQLECEAVNSIYEAFVRSKEACKLFCRKGRLLYPQSAVRDGTRCSEDPDVRDVCVQGVCRNVGCDNVLDSGIKVDRCGVCNGDSTTCTLIKNSYTKDYKRWGKENPDLMFIVPVGGTHVFVHERGVDENLIDVQDSKGNYLITVPSYSKTIRAAGTKIMYYREKQKDREWLYALGPTTERLRIVFLYLENGSVRNKGVDYQYYAPGKSTVTTDQVTWKYSSWTACSEKCAGGTQNRTVECIRNDDKTFVRDEVCLKRERKPDKKRACNTATCTPLWYVSQWRPCTKTCGKGIQTRLIFCRQKVSEGRYRHMLASKCRGRAPRPLSRECNEIACHPEWTPLAWSKCSKTCAGGFVTRRLACRRLNEHGRYMPVTPNMCRHAIRPLTREPCNSDVLCPLTSSPHTGPVPRYRSLGCFRDGRPFAIPVLVGNLRSKIKWNDLKVTVDACARLIKQRNPTYRVFGVKFYGECWSGREAQYTYDEYGRDDIKKCYEGVGTHHNYYVYQFV